MSYEIFISYSSVDRNLANAVCAKLEEAGRRCWIAPRDIPPGAEWGSSILDGIKACKMFLLLFSKSSDASPQVIREVERAVHHGLIVIPIRIEDYMPSGAMEYFLSAVHWLDALTTPFEIHLGKILANVTAIFDGLQTPHKELARRVQTRPQQKPAPFATGNYLSTGRVQGPDDDDNALRLEDARFNAAPFLLLRSQNQSAWMELLKGEIDTYLLRDGDESIFADGTVEVSTMVVTATTYKFNSSLDIRRKEIEKLFGANARHGSFEDVVYACTLLGSPRFIDFLELRAVRNPEIAAYDGIEYWNQGPFVTYNGATSEGTRAYFISVHDGVTLDDWRIIDTINSHDIDLGSWHNNRPLLVKFSWDFSFASDNKKLRIID